MEPKFTIYCHTHIESGRRYIGLTKHTMLHRWNQHCAQAKYSKGGRWHFPNAIRKYGKDAFSHEVLETCLTLEEANAAEQKWIEHFKTRDPQFGFNLAEGGSHTPHPAKNPWDDPEYRAKVAPILKKFIAAGHTPEAFAKMTATHRTPEFRAKRSEISKQFQADPGYRAKMSLIEQRSHARPEVKAKISLASRSIVKQPVDDATRTKLSRAGKGRQLSDSTKAKISATMTGKKYAIDSLKRIIDKERAVAWRAYETADDKITGKNCKIHGFVNIENCHVGKLPGGGPRVLCRLCSRARDKARKAKKFTDRVAHMPKAKPPRVATARNELVIQDGRVVGLQCRAHGLVSGDECLITVWPNGNSRAVCRVCAREADKRRKNRDRQRRGLPVFVAEGGRIERPSFWTP
jgi:hypothetical protein